MRGRFGLLLIACVLGACHQQDTAPPGPRSPGRYAGIGTFDAGTIMARNEGRADVARSGCREFRRR